MSGAGDAISRDPGGVLFSGACARAADDAVDQLLGRLRALGLADQVEHTRDSEDAPTARGLRLRRDAAARLAPGGDTLGLTRALGLRDGSGDDFEREVLVAMLAGPRAYRHDDAEALASMLRMRSVIVEAARRTTLAFHTEEADRPDRYWDYHSEARGFTLKPGHCLVDALREAVLPEGRDTPYAFSCCRATEYLSLLGIAEEARRQRPALYADLCRQWERRALTADNFRAAFLQEHGSLDDPLPARYYVPGDRVWFRNPDDHSSDATGYEGSWVFYLGGGLFTNFWKRDQPFTLEAKCLEVFHWRDATYRDARGELQIDEAVVESRVRATAGDPERSAQVLAKMLRLRDPPGVYREGGCIDASREHPRDVVGAVSGVTLPDA